VFYARACLNLCANGTFNFSIMIAGQRSNASVITLRFGHYLEGLESLIFIFASPRDNLDRLLICAFDLAFVFSSPRVCSSFNCLDSLS